MRSEDLYRSMSGIDDEVLKRCIEPTAYRRRKMHYRPWIAAAACVMLVLFGACFEPWQRFGGGAYGDTAGNEPVVGQMSDGDEPATDQDAVKPTRNYFVITANASELSDDVECESGDVYNLNIIQGQGGMVEGYLLDRFEVGGQNIDKIKISVDKNELYISRDIHEGDPDWPTDEELQETNQNPYSDKGFYDMMLTHKEMTETGHREWKGYYVYKRIVGSDYEGAYSSNCKYGFFVRSGTELSYDDPRGDYYSQVDMMNGAVLTVGVTYLNGEYEEHHYQVQTGRVVLHTANDSMYGKLGDRFLTAEEYETGEAPFSYSYLLERID
ncbi:MAG: hypothetical protein E7278_07505 [Lachnospiraceae bacterium]|nr:hypothetical protein [Lachnospiraceae bacterium]